MEGRGTLPRTPPSSLPLLQSSHPDDSLCSLGAVRDPSSRNAPRRNTKISLDPSQVRYAQGGSQRPAEVAPDRSSPSRTLGGHLEPGDRPVGFGPIGRPQPRRSYVAEPRTVEPRDGSESGGDAFALTSNSGVAAFRAFWARIARFTDSPPRRLGSYRRGEETSEASHHSREWSPRYEESFHNRPGREDLQSRAPDREQVVRLGPLARISDSRFPRPAYPSRASASVPQRARHAAGRLGGRSLSQDPGCRGRRPDAR